MKKYLLYIFYLAILNCVSSSLLFSQYGQWKQLFPINSPPPRSGHGMAYLGFNKVLVFGGAGIKNRFLGDTWIFDIKSKNWTEIKTSIHPAAADEPAMAYIDSGKVLLFGGETDSGASNDTWLFNLDSQSWTYLNLIKKPSRRYRAAYSFLGNKKVMIFSGFPGPDYGAEDTWIFDLSTLTWDSLKQNSPLNREQGMMCELNEHSLLLYGGDQGSSFNDNWIFDSNRKNDNWFEVNPKLNNKNRSSSSISQLMENRILLFGGDAQDNDNSKPDDQWSDDTWIFDGIDTTWIKIEPTVKPEGRYYHKMAKIDNGKVLLFGGIGHAILNDTWIFELDSRYTTINEYADKNTISIHQISSNELKIELSKNKNYLEEIIIYDILGVPYTLPNPILLDGEQLRVDISGLVPGVYFVKIGDRVQRFVKI